MGYKYIFLGYSSIYLRGGGIASQINECKVFL